VKALLRHAEAGEKPASAGEKGAKVKPVALDSTHRRGKPLFLRIIRDFTRRRRRRLASHRPGTLDGGRDTVDQQIQDLTPRAFENIATRKDYCAMQYYSMLDFALA
jgi:hypothetical protein